jgi:hypothetical protein
MDASRVLDLTVVEEVAPNYCGNALALRCVTIVAIVTIANRALANG